MPAAIDPARQDLALSDSVLIARNEYLDERDTLPNVDAQDEAYEEANAYENLGKAIGRLLAETRAELDTTTVLECLSDACGEGGAIFYRAAQRAMFRARQATQAEAA